MGIRVITTRAAKGSPLTWEEMDANLTGIDADATTLEAEMLTKAPLSSPALVGIPTTPTASPGTNTTQIASTAFVISAVSAGSGVTNHALLTNLDYASSGHTGFASNIDARFPSTDQKAALSGSSGTPSTSNRYVTAADSRLTDSRTPTSHANSHATGQSDPITPASIGAAPVASPTFTGIPAAPTATVGTNTTQIATTSFVNTSINNITPEDSFDTVTVYNSSGVFKDEVAASGAGAAVSLREGTNIVMSVSGDTISISSTATGGVTNHASLTNLDYASSGHTGFVSSTDLSSHTNTSSIHFTESSINHANIASIGTNSHTQIDTAISNSVSHIANTSNPHTITHTQVGSATANWNANKLQGVNVSVTAPTTNQVLSYNGSTWIPATVSSGGGISVYDAGDGCIVTASASGITFSKNEAGNPQTMTFSIPDGVTLLSADFSYLANGNEVELYCCPGNALEATFKFPAITIWNRGASPRVIEGFNYRKQAAENDRIYWVGSSNGATYSVRLDITYTGNGI